MVDFHMKTQSLGSALAWVMGKLGALVLLPIIICLSPLAIIWMWLDFKRLKRVALEVEPMREGEEMNVLGRAITFVALPIIVIVGACWSLFSSSDDDDGVIW
jgi:hypothetical protein